jgi:hypothetical protein
MKLCKDCEHFRASPLVTYTFCTHEDAAKDPVSGRAFADFERDILGNCGKDGKLFEAKPVRIGFFKRIFG